MAGSNRSKSQKAKAAKRLDGLVKQATSLMEDVEDLLGVSGNAGIEAEPKSLAYAILLDRAGMQAHDALAVAFVLYYLSQLDKLTDGSTPAA